MLLVFSLLLGLTPGDSLPRPAATVPPSGQPEQELTVVVHRQPALPVVALRLSLLADDPPGYAGAGHLFQHLAQASLRDQAAVVGARVHMQRTSDAVIYTIVGPTAELPYLAQVLASALRPPQASESALLLASRELAEERLAEWETADRHVRSALRARLFPADLSAAGTEASALRMLEGDAFRVAWAELYRPDRVAVVAVGDVTLEQVRSAFSRLPAAAAPRPAPELRDTTSLAPLAPAEATRGWTGIGYPAHGVDPAALSVATRLVREQLQRRLPASTVEAEHWWTHHGQALVVIAAAPEAQLATAQRMLGTALAATMSESTPAQVQAAAKAIRREMLFYSRTPERMAEVLGQFVDRSGDADAAQEFYAALERVSLGQVRDALRTLQNRSPVRADVPPQKLNRR